MTDREERARVKSGASSPTSANCASTGDLSGGRAHPLALEMPKNTLVNTRAGDRFEAESSVYTVGQAAAMARRGKWGMHGVQGVLIRFRFGSTST